MSRKSHDGPLCFRLTRLNSLLFFFYSLVLKISGLFYLTVLLVSISSLPVSINTASPLLIRRLYLERVRYLDWSVQGYGSDLFFILRVAFFFPQSLHTTQCSAYRLLALLLRICFLGCSVPLALIYILYINFSFSFCFVGFGHRISCHDRVVCISYNPQPDN